MKPLRGKCSSTFRIILILLHILMSGFASIGNWSLNV